MTTAPEHNNAAWLRDPKIRVALSYLLIALVWVVISELLLPAPYSAINRLIFVTVTGGVMGLLLRRSRIEAGQYARQLHEQDVVAGIYFESSAQGIVVVAGDGKILRANPSLERMFGYGRKELDGRSVEILVPDRLRSRHRSAREGYFKQPRSRPMGIGLDLAGRRKDGTEFPLEISLNYIPPAAGGPLVVCFVTDISDRLVLERQARQAETLNALGAIAAGIAHDLNNPLATIYSRSELMLSLVDVGNPDLRQDLEVLHNNAERASRIASGILSLAAQRTTSREPVDVNELVDATLLLVGAEFRRSNIEIVTALDRSLPAIPGDPNALQRALMNLMLNARDAMPGGGRITIASGAAPQRAGVLQLSVADTGAGIPADAQARLFDIFFTTKTRGTGLGLWIARQTVREHGGSIEVQSSAGDGTRFTLTLPLMGERAATAAD